MSNYKKTLQSEIKYQWKSIVKDYPLVAVTLLMGNKNLAPVVSNELSIAKEITELMQSQLNLAAATKVGVRLNNCFNNFDRDCARAQTSEDVKGAFTGLSNCLSGRKD